MKLTAVLVIACSAWTATAGSVYARADLAFKKNAKPCGKSFAAKLHDTAHCILFFIPQGITHPEDNQHFHNCCFGIDRGPK
ncbi:hypothetical protein CDD83_3313 [Cordyceps sp. RAO-2017]|nr:hypothetical protein CDD83_3313 [Cordyceps sp. RAO-2017]